MPTDPQVFVDRIVTVVHDCNGTPTEERLPLAKGWTIVTEEPVTLSPSYRCDGCGLHGFQMLDAMRQSRHATKPEGSER